MAERKDLVDAFNKPLSHTSARANTGGNDIEVILLSINQNSGLNLQHQCSKIILAGPAPSNPVFLQCCGRIVRIGQSYHCVIVEFYNPDTRNFSVMLDDTQYALPALAGFLNTSSLAWLFCLNGEDETDGVVVDS